MLSDAHWSVEAIPENARHPEEIAFYRQTPCRCSLSYDHYKGILTQWVDHPCLICKEKSFICDVDAGVINCPGEECVDCDYKKGDLDA